jgi:hypothetical protein
MTIDFWEVHMNRTSYRLLLVAILAVFAMVPAFAQNLNWDGQTGGVITPFAYVTNSPAAGLGMPTIAYHMVNGGDVLGIQNQVSINVGAFKRIEFGYSRTITSEGNTAGYSPLFNQDFNTFQAKVNILPENSFKTKLPAVSVGFVAHAREARVGDYLNTPNTKSNTGDIYAVATKTITNVAPLPIVLSAGVKGTNDVLNGLAGAAKDWSARGFGTAAFVVKTPFKSKAIFGAEVAQQPSILKSPVGTDALAGLTIPTTLTYFARVLPMPEKPINLDFALGQFAGNVGTIPGLGPVDLKARAQFAFGISYRL